MVKRIRPEAECPDAEREYLNDFEEDIEDVLLSLEERPKNLTQFNDALRSATRADALGENDELTIQYMQLALELGVAHFISALELPEKFGVDYLGKRYAYAIKSSKVHTDPDAWLNVVYLAIILRNQDALGVMGRISTEALRNANIKTDEANYLYVDFIKGLFDKKVDVGELLIAAMKATDYPGISKERTGYLLNIRVPLLSLYRCFLSNDQAEFNEKLNEAVMLHKVFWADNPKNYHDIDGWVSMDLLAVLSLAYDDKGWAPQIDSDYIPKWLVTGQYVQ
ncbi:immunity 49 family protein [Exilibacterium tricleocarpae]|nr:immunity 49 family protein [Exilibacterium tricleocarpae]